MKATYDTVSETCSRLVTRTYSTSFSLGIRFLARELRQPIYNIYGFVRLADEIVDSFHDYPKEELLQKFREDTLMAIRTGISINPVLNSFQATVNAYDIGWELIDAFLKSMEMDLDTTRHDRETFDAYIFGSAEVVGLMCLKVFTQGDKTNYEQLKPYALRLGAAFQKVNFLRDMGADFHELGRVYFPGVNFSSFSGAEMELIRAEVADDFGEALTGIKLLPAKARTGVYLAYYYYRKLFLKIVRHNSDSLPGARVRIDNFSKIHLLCKSFVRLKLNAIA